MAFITAEKNMDLINRTSASLGGYVNCQLPYLFLASIDRDLGY